MTTPSWPAVLPARILRQGFDQSLGETTLRTQMDAGPAKLRRRSTAAVQPLRGAVACTAAQWQTLRTFYEDTLIGGSLRFAWADPISGEAGEYRFVRPPGVRDRGPGRLTVALELERLP